MRRQSDEDGGEAATEAGADVGDADGAAREARGEGRSVREEREEARRSSVQQQEASSRRRLTTTAHGWTDACAMRRDDHLSHTLIIRYVQKEKR